MKVLLIIPPTSLKTSYGELREFSNPQPSIGLAYIAAVLRREGMTPRILDCYGVQMPLEVILTKVAEFQPDLVGISCLSTTYDAIRALSAALRERFPGLKIVGGNVHASLFAVDMLKDGVVDYVCHREGEYVLPELCRAIRGELALGLIQGISYMNNGEVIDTGERALIEDLDALPFPAWDLFPLDVYHTDPRTEIIPGKVEMQILATRGCPNACTFCSSRTQKSLGAKYRMRSANNICDELEYMLDKFDSRVFMFMDLAFPLVKKHAMSFFDEMVRRGLHKKIKWATECRVKPLDEETVHAMRESGCVRVSFGIESGSDEVLANLRKNFTVDDVKRAVLMMDAAGIEVDGMFMLGLPGESKEQIEETIRLATSIPIRYAIFNLFVPYPGSELYDILSSENKIRFTQWSDFTSYGGYSGSDPVYTPDNFTIHELIKLQKTAMRRFYLRPRFIWSEICRAKPNKVMAYLSGLKALVARSSN